jgi:hypothetical protein
VESVGANWDFDMAFFPKPFFFSVIFILVLFGIYFILFAYLFIFSFLSFFPCLFSVLFLLIKYCKGGVPISQFIHASGIY